jgi:small subunit ribosomal protein S20
MPIIKSAQKRVRTARKAAIRNAKTKRSLKTATKAFHSKASDKTLREAQSALDIAAKKNVIHKNKAARKQRQLAAAAKAAGIKLAAKKKAATKPAAKQATKSTTKKAATKKSPVKSAGKRTAAKK